MKKSKNWKDSITKRPDVGDSILVKMLCNDNIYFAVYTGEDEFDVHRPNESTNHRDSWYKFSHRSVAWWRYF
jgi:hypothetical protein